MPVLVRRDVARVWETQEVISDDREVVTAIRARLADRVGRDRYEVWFGRATELSIHGDNLVVSVPSQFFQHWLRSHFRKDLEASSLEVYGKPLALEFRIAESAVAAPPPARTTPVIDTPRSDAAAPAPAAPHAQQQPAAARAEPLGRRKFATLDTFVVGPLSCLAHKAAQMAAQQPGAYSPLLIHGPTGTGKTHLLEGIYTAFRQAQPKAAAVLLSAEQFTSSFVQAIHRSGMASFRAKYRDLGLLVIDDLQFLAGKRGTISELQHTIDSLLRSGGQLVFAADRAPPALKVLGPELVSRLSGGMVCRLEAAEYDTRLGIVRGQAARMGIAVPEDVQTYVASQFTTQARALIGALKRLQATSLAHERPITLAMAEEALAELIDHHDRVVRLPDIDKAVCDVFGLAPESLKSQRKGKSVSHPRALAMYLARRFTRAPLAEIGAYFGRRSHSTVISARKKVETWMSRSSSLEVGGASLSTEEAIRRVEEQLRAG